MGCGASKADGAAPAAAGAAPAAANKPTKAGKAAPATNDPNYPPMGLAPTVSGLPEWIKVSTSHQIFFPREETP